MAINPEILKRTLKFDYEVKEYKPSIDRTKYYYERCYNAIDLKDAVKSPASSYKFWMTNPTFDNFGKYEVIEKKTGKIVLTVSRTGYKGTKDAEKMLRWCFDNY